jgi:hypothetical protein
MTRKIVVAVLVFIVGGVIVVWMWNSFWHADATTRLQNHFGLTDSDVESAAGIEEALARKLPVGAPEARVLEFLKEAKIGQDRLSRVNRLTKDNENVILCVIEYDPMTFGFVKDHYAIRFELDRESKLVAIRVRAMLTGL